MFTDITNAFGTDAYSPAAIQTPSKTFYYKGLRLDKMPVRVPRAPKPLSQTVKHFLLTYNG